MWNNFSSVHTRDTVPLLRRQRQKAFFYWWLVHRLICITCTVTQRFTLYRHHSPFTNAPSYIPHWYTAVTKLPSTQQMHQPLSPKSVISRLTFQFSIEWCSELWFVYVECGVLMWTIMMLIVASWPSDLEMRTLKLGAALVSFSCFYYSYVDTTCSASKS